MTTIPTPPREGAHDAAVAAALDLIRGVVADLEGSNGVARPACLTLARELRAALAVLSAPSPDAAARES